MDLARRELARTWVHFSQKHQLELHPSSKELPIFASITYVNPNEKVLQQDHIDVSRVKRPSGVSHAEDSPTSGAEEYVVSTPTALETRRLWRTRAYMRRALDCYPKKVLRTVNPVKLKNENQCLFSEEPVKIKEVDKEDDQRQAMEKPAKAKTMTWMRRGATKAISTMMTKSAK
jgi:hypothetical protein